MQLFFLFLFFVNLFIFQCTPATTTKSLDPELKNQLIMFFSLFPDPQKTFPELSSLDAAITLLFEKTLKVSSEDLTLIRKFYAYLKQEAVQDFVDNISSSTQQQSLASSFAHAQEQYQLATHHKDQQAIVQWSTTLASLKQTIDQAMQKNLSSTITHACCKTESWQNHLKVFIANSFTYEIQLLSDINQDEIKTFSLLPQFETAYYTPSFTSLRNSANYVRLFLVITDILRTRALAQCNEWSKITDPAQLYDKIEEFKKSDFFSFCQKFDLLASQKTTTSLKNQVLISSSGTHKNYSIAKGYESYLSFSNTNPPVIIPRRGMESLFIITNNVPSLTPLGAFLLQEKTITPITGDPYEGLVPTTDFFKLFQENESGTGHVPKKLFLELISFNAIRILGNLTNYLFNSENLTTTMQSLHNLQTTNSFNFKEFPNFILYLPEDTLFLEELNSLSTIVSESPLKGPQPASFWNSLWDDMKNAFESMAHTLKSGFEKIGDDLWHTVQDAGNLFVHLAYSVDDLGVGLYYQTGIACLVQNISYSQASDDASNYFNAAAGQIQEAGNDCIGMVNNLCDVAQQVANMANSITAQTIGAIAGDPRLGNDLESCFDEVAAVTVDALRDSTDFLISVGTSLVKLTFEAVMTIEESAVAVIAETASGGQAGIGPMNAIASTGQYFAKDLITSILQAATLLIDVFTDALKNLMVAIGYLTSAITDLIVDVAGELAGLAAVVTGGNFWAADHSMQTELNAHRRLISSIVTLVLMTAMTIATMGTASALEVGLGVLMLVMGTGMMALSVVGANQQDMEAISQKRSQEAFLTTFQAYVNAIPATQQALQAQVLNETTQRLQEQLVNSDRALVYYQNYINNTLNCLRSTNDYALSTFYNELLTPDSTNYPSLNILSADTGYVYGLKTNRFDLNPSEGLRLYNSQRGTFAQEIATTPAPINPPTNQIFGSSAQIPTQNSSQHFIKQKDFANFTTPTLSVTVRWRVIYETGGDFYIGIYLNENYIDTTFLNILTTNFETTIQQSATYSKQSFDAAWQPFATFNRYLYNFDNLAKAFICYQNNQTENKPALGIYEHSSKEFLVKNQIPSTQQGSSNPWFKRGTWYQMTATLSGSSLNVFFQEENNPQNQWSHTTPITPWKQQDLIPYPILANAIGYHPKASFTGSYGIIASGAAVEYEVLNPKQIITTSPARSTSNQQFAQNFQNTGQPVQEIDREKEWEKQLAQNYAPQFADWQLTPLSNFTIAQGIFVYKTNATNLPLPVAGSFPDYVISLENPPATATGTTAGQSLLNSGAVLGTPITNNTSFLISLVTGNYYNQQGQFVAMCPDALAAFQQKRILSPSVVQKIQTTQQALYAKEEGALDFQNIVVKGVDEALKKGVPLYSCPSFTQYLTGLDYLIFVNIPAGGSPGIAQSLVPLATQNNINSALSLVTGTVFNLVESKSQIQITQLTNQFGNISVLPSNIPGYQNTIVPYQQVLPANLITTIQNQTAAYNNAETAAEQPPTPVSEPQPMTEIQSTPQTETTPTLCTSLQCLLSGNGLSNGGADEESVNFNFNM